MACFPPVDGSPSFPDFHDTIPPSQNTMHQISEDRALEDLKRLMSEFFGNEEPSCQSEAQLDEPYLENSSHDVAPSFDSLLPASCSQQFAQDMAFTDFFLSQSGNVRREDTSATPVNYPEVPLAEGMLAGSKRSYDAIDNEDYIERDHDEEVKDGVFDTVLPTASVSQISSNAVAFHNDDFSHYAAGQQSQFYYTGANQVVPLIGSASADNGSNSMIGPSHLDMVYPTRPHSEPVAPSNYDATGPQAGSGTMPLVPKSPYIKLPQLLRLNPASGHVSDNKQDHPVELGPLQSQYKATTHYSIHRRTQSMPAPGNVYPYPPNTHATPILPDNNNQAYFSHQFKPATAGQQIFANPVNHQAYAPYKLQPPTSGVPQMNAYSHCNIRSGPRVIRLPNCQSQVHYQQVPPVFTL
ncbi:hypothetical protein L208DRAFT_811151 [Tricholoma matsutake]|nr:hypothetical protein L208DRAFT_811151 [Tricholoma matsutake 945]